MYCRGFRAKLNKCAAENHNGSVISSHCGVARSLGLGSGLWYMGMCPTFTFLGGPHTHSHSHSQPSQKVKIEGNPQST